MKKPKMSPIMNSLDEVFTHINADAKENDLSIVLVVTDGENMFSQIALRARDAEAIQAFTIEKMNSASDNLNKKLRKQFERMGYDLSGRDKK